MTAKRNSALTILLLSLLATLPISTVKAADHLDSPFVVLDPRIDITDLYVFHPGSPGNQDLSKLVFVLNVHPLTPPGMKASFADNAVYQVKVDNTGDAVEDIAFQVSFTKPNATGTQTLTLRIAKDAEAREGTGMTVLATGPTEKILTIKEGGKVFAGLRDDSFFFDLGAFKSGLSFCSTGTSPDAFAGTNVLSIVVEVPVSMVGSKASIGVWAEIMQADASGKMQQVDRMGRPAINTVFVPSDKKNAFNAGDPKDDQANYRKNVVDVLVALGNSQNTANQLANVLLPDILTVDTSKETKFLNGRSLADDVIDAELGLITGGAVPSDCVDSNDVAFQRTFPYLAGPHKKMETIMMEDQAVKTDLSSLKSDVQALRSDVSGVKSDIPGLKSQVSKIANDVNASMAPDIFSMAAIGIAAIAIVVAAVSLARGGRKSS